MELSDLVGQASIDAALLGPEVKAAKVKLANEAAEYWRSISPVGSNKDPHPSRYRDSIHVVEDGAKVEVGSDDPIANLIEYGSVHNPEFACRARTEAHFNGSGGVIR